ncbi:hypothetical protein HK405_011294 [Cladochytrium tenue]|nr:hypothetical protein HK405_011294 [Cladochytrium tenue]
MVHFVATQIAATFVAFVVTFNGRTVRAGTSQAGSPTTDIGAACGAESYSCGAQNELGQDTINVCTGGVWVELDACEDESNVACGIIGGNPYCVSPSAAKTTATTLTSTTTVGAASAVVTAPVSTDSVTESAAQATVAPNEASQAGSPVTAVGASCGGQMYSCGPQDDAGQDTVNVCSGGVWENLDTCHDAPNTACTLIGGSPFCVAPTFGTTTTAAAVVSDTVSSTATDTVASTETSPTETTETNPTETSSTPALAIGDKGGLLTDTSIALVATDAATTASTSSAAVQFGNSCTTTYACGPTNDAGQGTIAICQGGVWVKLDDCGETPYTACEIIDSAPYCVVGTALIATTSTSSLTSSTTTTPTSAAVMSRTKSNSIVTLSTTTPTTTSTEVLTTTPTTTSTEVLTTTPTITLTENLTTTPTTTSTENLTTTPTTASTEDLTTSTSSTVATTAASTGTSGKDTVDPTTPYGAQGLTACQYDMLLQITSIYETSSTTLNYGICGDIGDGNGYSAGCVQFTTKSGSALKVVESYLETNPNSALAAFVAGLEAVVGTGTTSIISGFCTAWTAAAAADQTGFGASQRTIASQYYLTPNADLVSSLGLTTATGVGQIMDCAIQLGLGGCNTIAASTAATSPANGGDEATYLNAFLDARTAYINQLGGAYPATVTRVNSYRYIVQSGNLDFKNDMVVALDNDGAQTAITCSI